MTPRRPSLPLPALLLAGTLLSCQASSYTSFLRFGNQSQRDDLLQCARAVHSGQLEAHEEFTAAFGLFTRLTGPGAQDLEGLYHDYQGELEDCQEEALAFAERIAKLRSEAATLFGQWQGELDGFTRPEVRERSEAMLRDMRARHDRLVEALEGVQARMDTVLVSLRDYDLFFRRNLNPRAIATLEGTLDPFVNDVLALTDEMGAARLETESFLASLEGRIEEPAPRGDDVPAEL